MLNLFPTMFLALLAYATLRVFVGSSLLYLAYRHCFKDRNDLAHAYKKHLPVLGIYGALLLGVLEAVLGAMLFVGFFTQAAAIGCVALSLCMLIFRKRLAHRAVPEPMYYLLLLGASLSLFITGAGALAFDLPL